jgi:hypothetical protein
MILGVMMRVGSTLHKKRTFAERISADCTIRGQRHGLRVSYRGVTRGFLAGRVPALNRPERRLDDWGSLPCL